MRAVVESEHCNVIFRFFSADPQQLLARGQAVAIATDHQLEAEADQTHRLKHLVNLHQSVSNRRDILKKIDFFCQSALWTLLHEQVTQH